VSPDRIMVLHGPGKAGLYRHPGSIPGQGVEKLYIFLFLLKKMKNFFSTNIRKEAIKNNFFRKVLATKSNAQVVVMSLNPGEDIGMEVHKKYDQILVNVSGKGVYIVNGKKGKFEKDSLVYVPKGTRHNFINIGKTRLKLFTIYSPPNHPPGTVHKTKKEAERAEKD